MTGAFLGIFGGNPARDVLRAPTVQEMDRNRLAQLVDADTNRPIAQLERPNTTPYVTAQLGAASVGVGRGVMDNHAVFTFFNDGRVTYRQVNPLASSAVVREGSVGTLYIELQPNTIVTGYLETGAKAEMLAPADLVGLVTGPENRVLLKDEDRILVGISHVAAPLQGMSRMMGHGNYRLEVPRGTQYASLEVRII